MLSKIKRVWRKIGPGFITGSSDDDPSGIATYTQAGAAFGLHTLWTAWLSFPLMVAIQEMCARIGLVQQKGLTSVIKKYYPRWLLYLIIFISFPAITLNIGANIAAIGAVGNMLFPIIHPMLFSFVVMILLMWSFIKFSYRKIAGILKWLCLVLLLYIIVPFLVKQDLRNILHHTFLPHFEFTKEFLSMLVAILGTTISPYLFFWQANMEEEEMLHRKVIVDKQIISEMQTEIKGGMFYSVLIMYFITLTAGSVLYANDQRNIETVEQAAKALLPLSGHNAYLLFSIGIIGTGLLSIPVLAGSLSYMMAETFNWSDGLDKKFHQAKGFYITMIISILIGFSITIIGIAPIKALIFTAMVYGLVSPVLIGLILHICNSKQIMGSYTNNKQTNFWGILCLIIMLTSALLMLYLY